MKIRVGYGLGNLRPLEGDRLGALGRRMRIERAHYREPAGVGAQQGVELHVGAGPEPAEQDVGDPLALEVGALLGRRRPGLGPAAIRVEVERHRGPPRVQPHQRLVVGRKDRVRRERIETRQELTEVARDPLRRGPPPATCETLHLDQAVAQSHGGREQHDRKAEPRVPPHRDRTGHPDEGEPGQNAPEEPVGRERPHHEDQEVARQGPRDGGAPHQPVEAVTANGDRGGGAHVVQRRPREPAQGQIAEGAEQIAGGGPEHAQPGLVHRLDVTPVVHRQRGIDPTAMPQQPPRPPCAGERHGSGGAERDPQRGPPGMEQKEYDAGAGGDADGSREQGECGGEAGQGSGPARGRPGRRRIGENDGRGEQQGEQGLRKEHGLCCENRDRDRGGCHDHRGDPSRGAVTQ